MRSNMRDDDKTTMFLRSMVNDANDAYVGFQPMSVVCAVSSHYIKASSISFGVIYVDSCRMISPACEL